MKTIAPDAPLSSIPNQMEIERPGERDPGPSEKDSQEARETVKLRLYKDITPLKDWLADDYYDFLNDFHFNDAIAEHDTLYIGLLYMEHLEKVMEKYLDSDEGKAKVNEKSMGNLSG